MYISGTSKKSELRLDFNAGNAEFLPDHCSAPARGIAQLLSHLKEHGFTGVQGHDAADCAVHQLAAVAGGRVNEPGAIKQEVATWQEQGYQASTLHVGWGMESDALIDDLVGEIIETSAATQFPLFIETHRATITQDMWRTVEMVKRHPNIRFNGDFSHWYTGQEMVYGDWDAKVAFIAPVLERVGYFHGRVGNAGQIQLDITQEPNGEFLAHYKELWTKAMSGFLRNAPTGSLLPFAVEHLWPAINYGPYQLINGERVEIGDRWQQALFMADMARECFEAAQHDVL